MNESIHKNKDGRLRMYYKKDNGKHSLVSYPRVIMEKELNRKLTEDEIVHHIDGNPENNEVSNLQVMTLKEHSRMHKTKYHDIVIPCEVCGKKLFGQLKDKDGIIVI